MPLTLDLLAPAGHLEPVLMQHPTTGQPLECKLRCKHCSVLFSAKNPSRTVSDHLKACKKYAGPLPVKVGPYMLRQVRNHLCAPSSSGTDAEQRDVSSGDLRRLLTSDTPSAAGRPASGPAQSSLQPTSAAEGAQQLRIAT